jgi:hypothetical protein
MKVWQNGHLQDLTLFSTTKAAEAAPPSHGEKEGGLLCAPAIPLYLLMTFALHFFFPECTG